MNLLDLAVKITCEDQASDKVDGIGSKIKSGLGSAVALAGKAVAAGAAAAAAGAVAIGKGALDAYASYEQLVGGVDTLFKDSSGKLQRYAAQAYTTAGMSANTYMETVTSFSASLLQSLGNDTAAATEYANQAVIDMSDNANKMGSSIGSIQDAYQGFAKQNYTMLDNLKLGYGGTEGEMERLIEDANRVKQANGEMADLSIDSFADVTEAIHIIQTEMGITGTTSAEAATTIEGSINSMKGAWENWLVALGRGDEEVVFENTLDLIDSIGTVAGNVLPRVATIAQSMAQVVAESMPDVVEAVKGKLLDMLPESMREPAEQAMGILGEAMGEKVDQVLAVAQLIADNFGPLLQPAAELLGSALGVVSSYMGYLGDIMQNTIMPAAEQLIPIVAGIVEGLISLAGTLMPIVQQIVDAVMPVVSDMVSFIAGAVLQIAGAVLPLVQTVAGVVAENLPAIQETVTSVMDVIHGVVSTVWSAVEVIVTTAIGVIQSVISIVMAAISGDWSGVWNGIKSLASTVWNGIKSLVSIAINAVWSVISSVLETIKSLWDSAWSAISSFLEDTWNSISTAVSDGIDNVIQFFTDLPGNILSALGNLGSLLLDAGGSIVSGLLDGIQGAIEGVYDFVSGIGSTIASLKGPKEYDLKLLIPNGRWIMQSLADGLERGFPLVEDALSGITEDIAGADLSGDLAVSTVSSAVGSATRAGSGSDDQRLLESILQVLEYLVSDGVVLDLDDREFGRLVRKYA